MNWHVLTVRRDDLGLALGAIGLGGASVTATRSSVDEVTITYVTYGELWEANPAPRRRSSPVSQAR